MTDDAGGRPQRSTDADALEATPTDLTLGDVLVGAGDEVAVSRLESTHGLSWSAGTPPRPFVVLVGGRAEFRLDPIVARAALRTPDTSPSPRGAEWVAFEPAVVDDGAVDRAEAWFLAAHRRATSAGRPS